MKRFQFFILCKQTEELYEEILYNILHNVGCDADNETCPAALFSYIQEAFKIPSARHDELLQSAEAKQAPEMLLNVEVIEAKELLAKDPNGLSDPFVTIYMESKSTCRKNTSVKARTLNPIWQEYLAL